MSKRKELNNEDNFSKDDIPEGDEQHAVWQAAYGACFAAYAEEYIRSEDHNVVKLHGMACHIADVAYATYKESIGIHKRTKKQSSNGKKDFPTFNIGPVEILVETGAAILVGKDPKEYDDKGRETGSWFPKKCIHHTSEVRGKEECDGDLIVSLSMAEEKGYLNVAAQEPIPNEDHIPF